MKNKKSKIIIPAMGLILLSTAASISGSVAWFTANRTAKFNAGEFAVVKTSENLVYDLTAGAATAVTGEAGAENVVFDGANALTHASYNHLNNNIMKAAEDGQSITNLYEVASESAPTAENLLVSAITGGNVYAAATWRVDFKLTFGAVNRKVGLFIDWANTSFVEVVNFPDDNGDEVEGTDHTLVTGEDGTYYTNIECTEGEVTKTVGQTISAGKYYKPAPDVTGKGFRIGMYPIGTNAANGVARVMAKHQTEALSKHVSGADAAACTTNMTAGTAYTENYLLASNTDSAKTTLPSDNTALTTADDLNCYLGNFPYSANQEVTLSYMCIAWYEGTDPNIVNQDAEVKYETMASILAFSAVTLS